MVVVVDEEGGEVARDGVEGWIEKEAGLGFRRHDTATNGVWEKEKIRVNQTLQNTLSHVPRLTLPGSFLGRLICFAVSLPVSLRSPVSPGPCLCYRKFIIWLLSVCPLSTLLVLLSQFPLYPPPPLLVYPYLAYPTHTRRLLAQPSDISHPNLACWQPIIPPSLPMSQCPLPP